MMSDLDQRGLTPALSTIMLIALTVVGMSAVVVLLRGFAPPGGGVVMEVTSSTFTQGDGKIVVEFEHEGGESLQLKDLVVVLKGMDTTGTYRTYSTGSGGFPLAALPELVVKGKPSENIFGPAEVLQATFTLQDEQYFFSGDVEVQLINIPANQLLIRVIERPYYQSVEIVDASVTTQPATGVGSTSATLNASVSYGSYPNVNITFNYKRQGAAGWQTESVDTGGSVGRYTSIALDSSNNPHISYYDLTNQDLKYAKWTGSSWSIQTVDSSGSVGLWTSIALDSSDHPRISYYDSTNNRLKYAKWTGSSWSIEIVDTGGGTKTSIALDSINYPHISYIKSGPSLWHARWNGSSWVKEQIDWWPNDISIAVDSSNYSHIAYFETNTYKLKYARWNGSSWQIEVVDSLYANEEVSIALDSSNNPHIAYTYHYSPYPLKYAKWTGSSWSIQNVVNTYAYSPSIALDSSNRPRIAYFNGNPYFDLKYAKWTGSAWVIEDLDPVNTTSVYGLYASIALDSSDNPHIAYYDSNSNDLKYTKWAVSTWQSTGFEIITSPSYSKQITGLSPASTYEFYAYIEFDSKNDTGDTLTFNTTA